MLEILKQKLKTQNLKNKNTYLWGNRTKPHQ